MGDGEEPGDGGLGPIDDDALLTIRDVFLAEEPLVVDAGLDDPDDPRELSIAVGDGVTADEGVFTVRFGDDGWYGFHYSEEGVDWRFDRHPNPHGPAAHFHPPLDAAAGDVEASCIRQRVPALVARAVHRCWRRWYESGGDVGPNDVEDPP